MISNTYLTETLLVFTGFGTEEVSVSRTSHWLGGRGRQDGCRQKVLQDVNQESEAGAERKVSERELTASPTSLTDLGQVAMTVAAPCPTGQGRARFQRARMNFCQIRG